MSKRDIKTDKAPKAIGPYSQAIQAGGMLFISGQIALDPQSGEIVGKDIATQTARVMKNLQGILEAAGANFESVVKCTIFLKDMGDFSKVNEIYGRSFPGVPPARATVEVSRLPKDVLVEIDAIAFMG